MSVAASAREMLIAEAIGDLAQVTDRLEALLPEMEHARLVLDGANASYLDSLASFERRLAAVSETARTKVVKQVVDEVELAVRRSKGEATAAMEAAAQRAFATELGPTLQRLEAGVAHACTHRAGRGGLLLPCMASAATSAATTWVVTMLMLFG